MSNFGMRTRRKRRKEEDGIEDIYQNIRKIHKENGAIEVFRTEVENSFNEIKQYIEYLRPNLPQSQPQNQTVNKKVVTAVARVRDFEYFPADESMAGETCVLGTTDIEVGTEMVRLNCKGRHVFCRQCMDNWFRENSTCPLCRQVFR